MGAVFNSMDMCDIIMADMKLADTLSIKHILYRLLNDRRKKFFKAKI